MKITEVEKPITIVEEKDYPEGSTPEFLFVGRSNVGKSSLINSLLSRKNIAYTSQNPGKTQTLNFYKINQRFFIVDVPGYGYARVSKTKREEFAKMIEHYLTNRSNLKHIFVLIDMRHDISEDDVVMVEYLNYLDLPYTILATKADKISKNKRMRHLKQLKTQLALDSIESIIPYSAVTHENKEKVLSEIEAQL